MWFTISKVAGWCLAEANNTYTAPKPTDQPQFSHWLLHHYCVYVLASPLCLMVTFFFRCVKVCLLLAVSNADLYSGFLEGDFLRVLNCQDLKIDIQLGQKNYTSSCRACQTVLVQSSHITI